MEELNKVIPEPIELDELKPPKKSWIVNILRKVQKYSSYTFLSFYSIHSMSVIISPSFLPMSLNGEIFEISRAVYSSLEPIIFGSVATHILSGMILRYLKPRKRTKKVYENSDETGLGGITSLVGLGVRRSWISKITNDYLTPLSFSGYSLIPLLAIHFFKFKMAPTEIDGDSSLVSLSYISTVLNNSMIKFGPYLNFALLLALVYNSSYHVVSGMLKFRGYYSKESKKVGYGIISGFTLMGVVSLVRFKYWKFDDAYLLGKYLKYIEWARI